MQLHNSVLYQIAARDPRAAARLSQVSRNVKEGMRDRLQRAPVTARAAARRWKVKARFSRYKRFAAYIMKIVVRALEIVDLEYDKYRSKKELASKMVQRTLEPSLTKLGFSFDRGMGRLPLQRADLRVYLLVTARESPNFEKPQLFFRFSNRVAEDTGFSIRFNDRNAPAITYHEGTQESEATTQMLKYLRQEWEDAFANDKFETRLRIAREAARTARATPAAGMGRRTAARAAARTTRKTT